MKVFFNIGDAAAQTVTDAQHAGHPQDAADHVKGQELAVGHAPYASHRRRERADDGHEPREDDGLAAVLLKKFVGTLQMLFAEKKGILFAEDLGSREITDGVTDAVPHHRRGHEQKGQPADIQLPLGGDQSRRDQQRVPGQEKTGEDARLTKNDDRDADIAAPGDQFIQMMEL